ncbi:MAG: hypothetical protein K8I27_01555 [Planctomycetes bacterium]|nr:hypothetical protein [Planctomycetota bacterium]
MHRLLYTLTLLALLGTACTSSGEIVYTGANEDAREGDWIKDPEAEATTKDGASRQDTTRTESNRVDIPVMEFAQYAVTSKGYAFHRRSGYESRYVRTVFEGLRHVDYVDRDVRFHGFEDDYMSEGLIARRANTLYPGAYTNEHLSTRLGRDRYRAYSTQETPSITSGKLATEGMRSSSWVESMRGEAYAEGARTRYGYDAAFSTRVVGLHLWKYADRELVADSVEITYTLVYYNTNDFGTGPTEIDEPVPYYTEYIDGTATLPKEGTSVEYIKRDDRRNLLRWKFPKGIKAGETNTMKYKVTVKLDAEPEYQPPEDRPDKRDQ